MNLNLRSHGAVVTGGASGIGRAIAAGFRAEGCQVAIWDVLDHLVHSAASAWMTASPCIGSTAGESTIWALT
jgi:NAD(P)-dependent dehydrogenase (short-subunit alcohol dehydrogenase family)